MFSMTLVCEPITGVRAKDLTDIIHVNINQRIHYETIRIDSGPSDSKNEIILS